MARGANFTGMSVSKTRPEPAPSKNCSVQINGEALGQTSERWQQAGPGKKGRSTHRGAAAAAWLGKVCPPIESPAPHGTYSASSACALWGCLWSPLLQAALRTRPTRPADPALGTSQRTVNCQHTYGNMGPRSHSCLDAEDMASTSLSLGWNLYLDREYGPHGGGLHMLLDHCMHDLRRAVLRCRSRQTKELLRQ